MEALREYDSHPGARPGRARYQHPRWNALTIGYTMSTTAIIKRANQHAATYVAQGTSAYIYCTDNGKQGYVDIYVDGEPVDTMNSRDYATGGRIEGWDTRTEFARWLFEHTGNPDFDLS